MKPTMILLSIMALATLALGQDRSSSFVHSDPSLATEVPAKPSAAHVAQTAPAEENSTIMYPNEQDPYTKDAYSQNPAQPAAQAVPAPAPVVNDTAPMAKGSEPSTAAPRTDTQFSQRPDPSNILLPVATVLHLKLDQTISTENVRRGQKVEASLTQPVTIDGRVVLPVGSYVECEVLSAKNPRRIAGRPTIVIKARKAQLPAGGDLYFSASMIDTANPHHLDVDEEGRLRGSDNRIDNVELTAMTGSGAIAGAVIAGPTGFAVGTVTGAAFATGHRLVRHHHLTLPAGTELIFELDEPASASRELASAQR
ncbi:MAG: hypothetical protein P4M01_02865 [Acidobacteriota bacterium]|nr:hypothetical protein [Acidobacteriota bacterium]